MLGQLRPKRWQLLGRIYPRALQLQLPFLKRPLTRPKAADSTTKVSENSKDAPTACSPAGTSPSC